VKPGNIVGAIANEADIESKYIGHIEIFDDFSLVDLPAGMPPETLRELQAAWVCQRRLQISRLGDVGADKPRTGDGRKGKPRPVGKKPGRSGDKAKKKHDPKSGRKPGRK
jgi:ATP-dependent RNA helicase DeaD